MDQLTFTPQLGLILGGIVGLAIGWVIGFFDSNKRTEKKIQAAESNAEIAVKEAEKKMAEAEGRIAEASAQPQQVMVQDDPAGLLRLKNNGGHYALEMDGAQITGALAPDGKKRLIELLTVIRPYLEGGLPPQAPRQPAAPARPTPVMRAPAPQPVSIPQATAAPQEQEAKPEPELDANGMPKTLINPDNKKEMAKLGMIAQIDAILQWRLVKSPFEKRGIHVSEAEGGGVRVMVGLEKFEAVDDVSDPEVKAFIKAAIAEWEKKFTPGL